MLKNHTAQAKTRIYAACALYEAKVKLNQAALVQLYHVCSVLRDRRPPLDGIDSIKRELNIIQKQLQRVKTAVVDSIVASEKAMCMFWLFDYMA